MENNKKTIAVVGLGYVGLPLAVAFAKKKLPVIGFDISERRVSELEHGKDHTHEVASRELRQATLSYTTDPTRISQADFVIVAVPTPVYENKEPDLRPVKSASEVVGKNLKPGTIVIYESTVWPGLTEDFCVPIIEKLSHKKCGKDWFIAYSPERINPGDKVHRLGTIVKVVAGMDEKTRKRVGWLYRHVCGAGVFEAASIKAAEAAKVIENTQRDLNIALMNELAMIFKKLGIKTRDVLNAAFTKWNFGRYSPGMVGGHCISVDPYYLTTLAKSVGYNPQVILAGRAINDNMPNYVVSLLEEGLGEKKSQITNHKSQINSKSQIQKTQKLQATSYKLKVLVLGLTFKENVPDTRNSPAKYVIRALEQKGFTVDTYDPHVTEATLTHEGFGGTFLKKLPAKASYGGVIVTVAHREFVKLKNRITSLIAGPNGVLVDVRGVYTDFHPPKGVIYKTL